MLVDRLAPSDWFTLVEANYDDANFFEVSNTANICVIRHKEWLQRHSNDIKACSRDPIFGSNYLSGIVVQLTTMLIRVTNFFEFWLIVGSEIELCEPASREHSLW